MAYGSNMSIPRLQSDDTTAAAERLQFEVWRRMTATEKLAAFEELQATAQRLAEAGIRMRHPNASDHEVFLRRIARSLDRQAMIRWFGWDPQEHGA